ncbi:MAG: hypothetical protein IPG02_10315 [Ignavibacteria bacterium]|nr:hypothetical protein [Ignavibacteria bacterium]
MNGDGFSDVITGESLFLLSEKLTYSLAVLQ